MTSPRFWVVTTPDLTNVYSPIDEYVIQETVHQSELSGNLELLGQVVSITAGSNNAGKINSIYTFDVQIELDITDYSIMRAVRTLIIEDIKNCIEHCNAKGRRGKRAFTMKRPVVAYDYNKQCYVVCFKVNCIDVVFYSLKRQIQVASGVFEQDLINDLHNLQNLLNLSLNVKVNNVVCKMN